MIALDTPVALCGELAGTRLLSSGVDLARATITRCLTAHGGSADRTPLRLTALRMWCVGSLEVPSLEHLEHRLRHERIRRDYKGGLDYAAVARRYVLQPCHARRIIAAANGAPHGTAARRQQADVVADQHASQSLSQPKGDP